MRRGAGTSPGMFTPSITATKSSRTDGRDAYVNDVLLTALKWPPAKPESVHPNTSGYAAETGAILAWSATVAPAGPDTRSIGPQASTVTCEPWSLWTFDTADVNLARQATVDGSLFKHSPVGINGTGYQPGTLVTIMIHSTPAVLGTLVADDNGNIHGQVHLPPSLELGQHEIVASGTNRDGTFRTDRVAVRVLAQPPLWTQFALLGSGALLLMSVVFSGLWWRHRREPLHQGAAASR